MAKTKTKTKTNRTCINLALQGGGAHGAYTWGVLDRLLDDPEIDFSGISGTSAGAMNAVVMIDGLAKGGRKRAKAQLEQFWREVSQFGGVFGGTKFDDFTAKQFNTGWNFAATWMDILSRTFSPYELNPMNYNPLRNILDELIDWKKLHKHDDVKLFVTATNVETGQPRTFSCQEITIDVLMASACIPFLYQAVIIEDQPYWDGGYVGNPAIWPLIYNTHCDDIVLVQINPLEREGIPKRAIDIIDRLNEISFNTSLIDEMRAIHFVQKLIKRGRLTDDEYKDIRMHMIASPDAMHGMTASTKLTANWDFFTYLHDIGYGLADEWLKTHKKSLGKKGTLDIEKAFLQKHKSAKTALKAVKSAQNA